MVWGAVISGLGYVGTSFIPDEKARAAANMAIAGVAAGACDPTGLGIAGAAIIVAKEVAALVMAETVENQDVKNGVMAGFNLASSCVNGGALVQTLGGAAVGAAAGAVAESQDVQGFSTIDGMVMGSSLAQGGAKEVIGKTAGVAIGGATAIAINGDSTHAGAAFSLGAQMGMQAGGAAAKFTLTTSDVAPADRNTAPQAIEETSSLERALSSERWNGTYGLVGQAAGASASALIREKAASNGDADTMAAFRAGTSVGGAVASMSSTTQLAIEGESCAGSAVAAAGTTASATSDVVRETTVDAKQRRAARMAEHEDGGYYARQANELAEKSSTIGRVGNSIGDAGTAVGGGVDRLLSRDGAEASKDVERPGTLYEWMYDKTVESFA